MSSDVWMTCGHKYLRSEIKAIIEDTLKKSRTATEFQCTYPKCRKKWDLDYCAEAAQLTDDDHFRYAEEIANRAAPTTKQCPYCKAECAEPEQKGIIRVRCPSCFIGDDWCWLCSSKWNNIGDYKNCGNEGCKSYVKGSIVVRKFDVDKPVKQRNAMNDDYKAEPNEPSAEEEQRQRNDTNEQEDKPNKKTDKKPKKKRGSKQAGAISKDTKAVSTKKPVKKPLPARRKMKGGLVGLSNLGNTCFMNAALQTMLKTPQFVNLFFYDQIEIPTTSSFGWNKKPDTNSLTYILSQFIKQFYTANSRYISPYDIKRALNGLRECIGNGEQQDSFYVISTLLQALDKELCSNESEFEHELNIYDDKDIPSTKEMHDLILNKVWKPYVLRKTKNDKSCIIRETFDGIECETLSCCICDYKAKIFKPFREIELPLVDKLISLTIKVFVPQINRMKAYDINLDLTYDNTLDGLKYLILAKVNNSGSKKLRKLDKENLNIKIGYIHSSNNTNNGQDMNKWFRYLNDDNNDCSKIPNHAQLIALVYDNRGNLDDDDDEKMDTSKTVYIPRFNVICNQKDQWTNYVNVMTFTKFWSPGKRILGKDIIDYESEITPEFEDKDYILTVFYNNRVVHPESTIKITKKGCLLCIWVHKEYRKESPTLDPNISFAGGDGIVIQNAISNTNTNQSGCFSFENMWDMVSRYYNKLPSLDLSPYLPGYTKDMEQQRKKQRQEEKDQAEKTMDKLQKLSNIEKCANKWLNWRLSDILKTAEKQKINITSPRVLNNISECLEAYESNEVSNANIMDCLRCDDCPEIVSRQVQVIQTPNILILHIDRYGNNDDGGYYGKRNHMIKYPVYNLKFKHDVYDLYGVIVHHGGNNGGHYFCYAKSFSDNRWFEMNDTSVSPVNEMRIITKNATVLLYHKQNNQ